MLSPVVLLLEVGCLHLEWLLELLWELAVVVLVPVVHASVEVPPRMLFVLVLGVHASWEVLLLLVVVVPPVELLWGLLPGGWRMVWEAGCLAGEAVPLAGAVGAPLVAMLGIGAPGWV